MIASPPGRSLGGPAIVSSSHRDLPAICPYERRMPRPGPMQRRRRGPKNDGALHVVELGVDLDPEGQSPEQIIHFWRDFARAEAAAATAPGLRITIAQAAWSDDRRQVEGIDCHFVRDPHPLVRLPGERVVYRMPGVSTRACRSSTPTSFTSTAWHSPACSAASGRCCRTATSSRRIARAGSPRASGAATCAGASPASTRSCSARASRRSR